MDLLQSGHALAAEYPHDGPGRDKWILNLRPPRDRTADPYRPHGSFAEEERTESGRAAWFATLLLTNRECPWRCLMCDLWKTTLTEDVPVGGVPTQIDYGLKRLSEEHPQHFTGIKLYNGGSFFDPHAIPPPDYAGIAERVCRFERIVVECHPAFVGRRCLHFRNLLLEGAARAAASASGSPQLEVAIGLETAHPDVLQKLNKRMTLEQFARAAAFVRENQIALRAFVLVKPPFLNETEALYWANRSIEFAFAHGANIVSLIPTRQGNGAMDALLRSGHFAPPQLSTLETAAAYGISLKQGRVFADLWDMERFSSCSACYPARLGRLRRMNLEQTILPEAPCPACGHGSTRG